ncbi:hypothetical protein CC1G_12030 [Coprinopsis cinerea okayama7|uniref:MYND-type domain-containing protein n=1 Tax=Coprinopsis cinerea (strain Okayama-7 / 130 / ATCC MYA-4618 / FGSC 9003) TaxID=240176 RepID=A8P8H1_COPC7|nr:hypothetical protein CC1G_12030 [Coprinopsis cinerea okayama7\|eukprot:XP_001839567.2 hypothetical protein CC1G_12030 [Coprinopsis cinerea okayama7\
MRGLPTQVIASAKAGSIDALERLYPLFSEQTYTLSLLEAVLANLDRGRLPDDTSKPLPPNSEVGERSLVASACFLACLGCCHRSRAHKLNTVAKIHSQLDAILTWLRLALSYALECAAPLRMESIVFCIARTLVGLLGLDDSLREQVLESRRTGVIVFTLWCSRDNRGKPFCDFQSTGPGRCPIIQLVDKSITLADTELSRCFWTLVFSSPKSRRAFCDGLLRRWVGLPLSMPSQNTGVVLRYTAHLTNLALLLPTIPAIYRPLRKTKLLSQWGKSLLLLRPNLSPAQFVDLCSDLFSFSNHTYGNPLTGLTELIETGVFVALLQAVSELPPGSRSPSAIKTLGQCGGLAMYPSTTTAFRSALQRLTPQTKSRLSEMEGVADAWRMLNSSVDICLPVFKNKGGLGPYDFCDSDQNKIGREGSSAFKLCSGCQTVLYCSQQCQKEDWESRHRYECMVMRHSYRVNEARGVKYSPLARGYHTRMVTLILPTLSSLGPFERFAQHTPRDLPPMTKPVVYWDMRDGFHRGPTLISVEDLVTSRRTDGVPSCPKMEERLSDLLNAYAIDSCPRSKVLMIRFRWSMKCQILFILHLQPFKPRSDGDTDDGYDFLHVSRSATIIEHAPESGWICV